MPQNPLTDTHSTSNTAAYSGTSLPGMPTIEGYDVVDTIGEGGMGIVYRGLQLALNRPVAIKSIRVSNPDKHTLERFMSEAKLVASLAHPHIVQVYDSGTSDVGPYIVMEYLPGGSLSESLKKNGRWEPRHAATLLEQIAEGVQQAHAKGIVHRDLKPGNVLFDADGSPKVSDFGLAKRFDSLATATQGLQGTPLYMAPEQAHGDGRVIGPPADVWALGVILYELLTDQSPFADHEPYATIRKVIEHDPPPPSETVPNSQIPPELDAICLKCLRKDPSSRYANGGELAHDLGQFLKGDRILATRERRRVWARAIVIPIWALALSMGMSLLACAVWWIRRPSTEAFTQSRRLEVERQVAALLRMPPQPDQAIEPAVRVEQLERPDYSAFHYLDDDRIFDLRAWKPESDSNFVVMKTRQRLLKTKSCEVLTLESRTTGRREQIMRAIDPNSGRVRAASTPIKVGRQSMHVQQLDIDVRDIELDREFDVRASTTLWPRLESKEERWFGLIGYEGAEKSSILLVFPEHRPFASYQLRRVPAHAADPVPFVGPRILLEGPGNRWLYWEVPKPTANQVYRIDWEW